MMTRAHVTREAFLDSTLHFPGCISLRLIMIAEHVIYQSILLLVYCALLSRTSRRLADPGAVSRSPQHSGPISNKTIKQDSHHATI
jgi:hypothetical protein